MLLQFFTHTHACTHAHTHVRTHMCLWTAGEQSGLILGHMRVLLSFESVIFVCFSFYELHFHMCNTFTMHFPFTCMSAPEYPFTLVFVTYSLGLISLNSTSKITFARAPVANLTTTYMSFTLSGAIQSFFCVCVLSLHRCRTPHHPYPLYVPCFVGLSLLQLFIFLPYAGHFLGGCRVPH